MSRLMKIVAIVQANLVRTSRDRLGLFFIVLLPLILIVVLGMTYGSGAGARVGVADLDGGPLARQLVASISDAPGVTIEIRSFSSVDALRDASSRGFVEFGLVIPAGYDAALQGGRDTSVTYIAPGSTKASATRSTVDRAVAEQAALFRAARFVASTGVPFDRALSAARASEASAPGIAVSTQSVAEASTTSGYDLGAQSQVVLFMFLTSLTGAVELVTTRRLGVSRRMLATPTGAWTIIAGEALARVVIALFQGFFIIVASAILFGVDWIDPLATAAIVVVFAVVCGGAALLVGTVANNPSQAGSIGAGLGLLLGLLGGTMVPPEVFPEVMRTLSHLTPHAWAMDAFRTLLVDGGGMGAILGPLGALLVFAAVLLGGAVLRFRQVVLAGA